MEITELTIRIPKSWHIKLTSMVESADYPSLNAMMLELLDEAFELPREAEMGDRIDEWWERI